MLKTLKKEGKTGRKRTLGGHNSQPLKAKEGLLQRDRQSIGLK